MHFNYVIRDKTLENDDIAVLNEKKQALHVLPRLLLVTTTAFHTDSYGSSSQLKE